MDTRIAIGVPKKTYSRRVARSSKTSKYGIAVGGGVIDADYTGEVKVILQNHGNSSYKFKEGDNITKHTVERLQIQDAIRIKELGETKRGTHEFG